MTQDVATAAPDTRRHRRRRVILLAAIAVVLVVAISLVAVSCLSSSESTAPTVRVDRGTVALAVSASGNIAPSAQQNLGFTDGGTVSEVTVQVGDRVEAGQVLARVDDTVARRTLTQRQARVDQELATLDKLRGNISEESARANLDQARDAEAATRRQVDTTNSSNRSATSQARTRLRFDESALDRAEDQLRADRSSCRSSPRTTTPSTQTATSSAGGGGGGGGGVTTAPPNTAPPNTVPTNTVPTNTRPTNTGPAVPTGTGTSTRTTGATVTRPATSTGGVVPVVTTRVVRLASSGPLGDLDDDLDAADERTGPACSRLISDRQAVEQAQSTVVSSRSSLDSAEQRERTDAESGRVSLVNARQSIVSAQNDLNLAQNDNPDDIANQEARVEELRADVALAQRDLDETVITAPVAGTIIAINGATGEVVSAPSAVTPLAPGGTAPLPDQSSGGAGTGTSGTAPGSGSFLVLDAADPFQLVVPFEEADAARVTPGQPVDVAVDALPNDVLTGRVTSVAPAGTDLSGIVSYYATVVVDGGADRLRDGQTAEANVRVESVDNVLRVPTSAVRRVDGRPTVTVAGPDGNPVSMPFLAGLVGDDYVEVRSGLADGDQVELPQATVTAAPDPGGPPPGN